MSTTFLEKVSSGLEDPLYILRAPMKKESFAEYLARVMKEKDLTPVDIERRAKHEASRRGLEGTHSISDATVNNILTEQSGNVGMYKLMALAWGLDRPPEEVVFAALGLGRPSAGFQESAIARLYEMYKALPQAEKPYFTRCLESLEREMEDAMKQKKL